MHVVATATDGLFREDCAIASPTASGAPPIASCKILDLDNSSSVRLSLAGTEAVSSIPVQGTAAAARNGAGNARMAVGGVAVTALLAVAGAMSLLFGQM